MPVSDKAFDQLLSVNIAAAVCSPSQPAMVRIPDKSARVKALGLLRQRGGYARYPQDVFGISKAQLQLLSEHRIPMDVVRPALADEAA